MPLTSTYCFINYCSIFVYNIYTMVLQEKEKFWLAGLLEGEGCFHVKTNKTPLGITLEMTDEDIVKRVSNITGNSYCKVKKRKTFYKQSFKTTVRGKVAIEIMKLILPIMGVRRSIRIKECIDSYVVKPLGKLTVDHITAIKERFANGEKPKIIALDYDVTHWRIYQIVRE